MNSQNILVGFAGGVGKFGTNLTIFQYNQITVWIDIGMGFASENTPGIKKSLPNVEMLKESVPNIIIITHAHEDHIGAFVDLIDFIPKKTILFLSEFTHQILYNKLNEANQDIKRYNIQIIKKNVCITKWQLDFHFFFIPHSIPGSFSVGIHFKEINKKIYFTSDFKLKGNEPNFNSFDIQKFAPIDYLFCDSTGILSEGEASSEHDIKENLQNIITSAPSRIFITLFSSNIERIQNIFEIAQRLNKQIGLLGYSLKSYLKAAFLVNKFNYDIKNYRVPSNKVKNSLFLVAGCQADVTSNFYKLSHGLLKKYYIKDQDTVIYSARTIPGNETTIYNCLNKILNKKIFLYGVQESSRNLHVSGHAKKKDILQIIQWLQPKNIIPVHGEPLQFQEFHKLISTYSLNTALKILKPHCMYHLTYKEISIKKEFIDSLTYMDGQEMHQHQYIFDTRKVLFKHGIVNVMIEKGSQQILKINYIGVQTQDFIDSNQKRMHKDIQFIVNSVNIVTAKGNQNTMKDKIYQYYIKFLNKEPYINIIFF